MYAQLLGKCIRVIESYNPKRTTVDAHCDDSPILKDKNLTPADVKFIHQVTYGCIRYQKLLKLFVTSFLYRYGSCTQRSDQTLYMVLGYLLLFRVEELGIEQFRDLYLCGVGNPAALNAMLQYVFCEEDLNTWVKMEWCKHYDIKFVEEDLIGRMQRLKPDMQFFIDEVELKATGTLAKSDKPEVFKSDKEVTKCMPFNLTKVQPRLIPEPEVITREVKAEPVPSTLNRTSLEKITEERTQRLEEERKRVREKYVEERQFHFETANRPGVQEEHEFLAKQVQDLRMQECTFTPAIARPFRAPEQAAEVRQNAASILREDALLTKKQTAEVGVLKRYEQELQDASGYYEWQQKMRVQDHEEEQRRVHMRKVEMEMAREAAIEACELMHEGKHIMASHLKEEKHQMLVAQEAEQQKELQGRQQLVQEIIDDRIRPRKAEEKILKGRIERATTLRKEMQHEVEIKKRNDAHEMERKLDLIRQIRAIERVNAVRINPFDPSEAPRGGYMEEMSLSELRERFSFLQARQQKELEDKREANLEKKLEKQNQLTEKADVLAKIREQAKTEAKERHAREKLRKQEEEERKEKFREDCVLEVTRSIKAKKKRKREEHAKLVAELKEIGIRRQFLAASAEMVEAKQKEDMDKGLEREARTKQNQAIEQAVKYNRIQEQQQQIRLKNKEDERQEFRALSEQVRKNLEKAKADDFAMKEDIKASTRSACRFQKNYETTLFAETGWSANRYSMASPAKSLTSTLGSPAKLLASSRSAPALQSASP